MRGIVNWYKKSDAAVAVQKLLEHQAQLGWLDADPAQAAREYVQNAWDDKPQVFSGKFGQRPHKIAVAVYSLALASKSLNEQNNSDFSYTMIALGNAVSDIEASGSFYPLSNLDYSLIKEGVELVAPIVEQENVKFDSAFGIDNAKKE